MCQCSVSVNFSGPLWSYLMIESIFNYFYLHCVARECVHTQALAWFVCEQCTIGSFLLWTLVVLPLLTFQHQNGEDKAAPSCTNDNLNGLTCSLGQLVHSSQSSDKQSTQSNHDWPNVTGKLLVHCTGELGTLLDKLFVSFFQTSNNNNTKKGNHKKRAIRFTNKILFYDFSLLFLCSVGREWRMLAYSPWSHVNGWFAFVRLFVCLHSSSK